MRKRPRTYSPRMLRLLLLWPGEATTLTLQKLDVAVDPADDKPFDQLPLGQSHDFCYRCGDSGLLKKLSKCCEHFLFAAGRNQLSLLSAAAMCDIVMYCGKTCQAVHWKGESPAALAGRLALAR